MEHLKSLEKFSPPKNSTKSSKFSSLSANFTSTSLKNFKNYGNDWRGIFLRKKTVFVTKKSQLSLQHHPSTNIIDYNIFIVLFSMKNEWFFSCIMSIYVMRFIKVWFLLFFCMISSCLVNNAPDGGQSFYHRLKPPAKECNRQVIFTSH